MKTTKKSKLNLGSNPSNRNEQTPPVAAPSATPLSAVKATSVRPPEIRTGKPSAVRLELLKPEAKAVYVAGTFNQWKPEQTPLSAVGNGRWIGNLNVGPGRYEYLFVVDGQWLPDPNARETVQNPYGGQNCILTVSA